jgi:predicted dehydrogenase
MSSKLIQHGKLSRRNFFSKTAVWGAGLAMPAIIPRSVLAAPGRPGANDRILTGHIGIGGMGKSHLRADTVALCEVDTNHLQAAHEESVKRGAGHIDHYLDYRYLLERKDLDAMVIATPDHWHGLQTVHACEAGFDVYVQKPSHNTIEEGQAMIRAARRYGRVVQVGSQGRSTPAAHAAATYIQNGEIGDVKEVVCWHSVNRESEWTPDQAPPPELDWDKWLGPCQWVPYNETRCHFNFRWFLEYGGGNIRDRGAHVFSVILWALNREMATPVSVEATGTPPKKGLFDCPIEMDVKYEFKDPDWTLIWRQPGEPKSGREFGAVYYGTKGELLVNGGDGGCDTEDKAMNYVVPPGGVHVFKSPGHEQNFYDCMKTRERPIMDIEAGVKVGNLCVMGNVSYILGRKLYWDGEKEEFTGDEEANRYLARPGRAHYQL